MRVVADQTAIAPGDTAALARGGRTNVLGFGLRLGARVPFLYIAGRLYGATLLGRFAYASLVVEFAAALATLGLRRGLAKALTGRGEHSEAEVVADALLLASLLGGLIAGLLILFPSVLFQGALLSPWERLFPLVTIPIALSDVSLAALAFHQRIRPTVTARALVEPWVLTIVGTALVFTPLKAEGLLIGYLASLSAAAAWSLWPCAREFGRPARWRPHPGRLRRLAADNAPLAAADLADWGARRLDLLILGQFVPDRVIGVYWTAQQLASLPQKLKSSFDPILAPLLTGALARGDRPAIAADVRQVGFWILAAQLALVLPMGLTGEGTLGTFGPAFAAGAGVLAWLFAAEIVGGQASVAESALVYLAPAKNLWASAAGIAVQLGVTVPLVLMFGAAGAAAGLALGLATMLGGKARLLRRELGSAATGLRWSLVAASLPAVAAGLAARQLPELYEMVLGIPVMLAVYVVSVWLIAFRGADRLLFARAKPA